MNNTLWGWDKNQVRVYMAGLQTCCQRENDQNEEALSRLGEEIGRLNVMIAQLQQQVDNIAPRMKWLEQLEPVVQALAVRTIKDARLRATLIHRQVEKQAREIYEQAADLESQTNELLSAYRMDIQHLLAAVQEREISLDLNNRAE